MKRCAAVLIILCSLASPLFAGGKAEAGEYEPVEGLENWDHTIDLSGYEEGKYNLIIRGTDAAGNLRYQGPYNLFVDPASDLPRLRISNPTPGMRVGDSLNVVGACLDDDAVQRVELQLDDEPTRSASGTEFWALPLDLEGLPDGEHTLRAWGIDINGNSGEAQSVSFQLDRRAPVVQITSHDSGALVSGNIVLRGTTADANGIRTVGYSRAREAAYQPLKLSYEKAEGLYAFELKIDTAELEDGPQVFWFRAEDITGSAAYLAFLLFVNNEEPLLEILSPTAEETVNGKLLVAGKAYDRIGLRSLTYEVGGGQSGDVELVLGNPFWTQEFDLRDRKAGALQIEFTLENLTGNKRTEKLKVRLEPEADKPQVMFTSPREDSRLPKGFTVTGNIRDDDGGKSIEYSLDGGAATTVAATAAFRFDLDDLDPGRHSLSVQATDIHGFTGDVQKLQFTVLPPPPRVSLSVLRIGETTADYRPGILVSGDQKTILSGEIHGSSLSAEYSLQGGAAKRLSLKKATDSNLQLFEIPLVKELAAGRVDIDIRCSDAAGGSGEFQGFLFLGSPPESAGEILLADARIQEDGRIVLEKDRPLFGYLPAASIDSVTLDPPTDLVAVRAEGELLRIEAAASGVSEVLRIIVSAQGGGTLQSRPLQFITDLEAPAISLVEPASGSWFADSLAIAGDVRDSSGVRSLEWALGEGTPFSPLELTESGGALSFSSALPAGNVQDGPVLLIVRATDAAGNVAEEVVPLLRDGGSPVLTLVAPGPEDELNGQITLVGRVEDPGTITRIEFRADNGEPVLIGSGPEFRYDLNLSQYESIPQSFSLKAVDAAGNEGFLEPFLNINPEADKPVVEIQVPGAAEVIKNDFIISGMVFDDDQVGRIFYSLDGGEFLELPGGNNFSIPLSIDSLSDNEHTVAVRAEDIGGLSGQVASSTFLVSTSEPTSRLGEPDIGRHLRGVIELTGESSDPNGIAEVFISFDNGHSFQLAEGTESWRYRLDTTLLADGTHALLIKAVDSTATEGLFTTTINIDNGAPQIVVDSPSDGEVFTRTLRLNGRSVDNIGLTGLVVRLIPATAGAGVEAGGLEYPLRTDGLIIEEIDIGSLAAGWYNLSVEAEDAAGNRSFLSRNIILEESAAAERVDLLFPVPGAGLTGEFSVSGRVVAQTSMTGVLVLLDGAALDTAEVDPRGFFHLDLSPEQLSEGSHTVQIQAQAPGGAQLLSEQRIIRYSSTGPWVQVVSHPAGAFVSGRPYLEGRAGYIMRMSDAQEEPSAKERKRERDEQAEHAVQKIEVSFDNGSSFQRADGKEQWRYRLETQSLPNGPLRILVRATFADGEAAVTHTQLQVDTRAPELVLLSPEEGGRFNQEISLRGTAADETGLQSVEISLREGDKSRYGVPKFIQGLYLDIHALGATYGDLGLGLTFFDDNVKLQLQAGVAPPGRFSGLVVGAKLLANLATVPFGYFFGPSWDYFSMSLALGANFSYFTMSGDALAFTSDGLVLAAVVTQLEFARFEVPEWRFFNTYSLYSEVQLWFISSDVEAGTAARLSFGFRMGLL